MSRKVLSTIFGTFVFIYCLVFFAEQTGKNKKVAWVDHKIEEADHSMGYTAHYPQHNQMLESINRLLKQVVHNEIAMGKNTAHGAYHDWLIDQSATWRPSHMHIAYEIMYADDTLVSILFTIYFDVAGTAHPSVWHCSFNYDVASQKELQLTDIAGHDSDYLKIISRECLTDLYRQVEQGVLPYSITIDESGLAPIEDNFSIFTLTPDKITFHFAQYQVAPYSLMSSVSLERLLFLKK